MNTLLKAWSTDQQPQDHLGRNIGPQAPTHNIGTRRCIFTRSLSALRSLTLEHRPALKKMEDTCYRFLRQMGEGIWDRCVVGWRSQKILLGGCCLPRSNISSQHWGALELKYPSQEAFFLSDPTEVGSLLFRARGDPSENT